MRHLGVLGTVASFFALSAVGQTMHVPMGYMWASSVPPGFDDASSAYITPMVHVNAGAQLSIGGQTFNSWEDGYNTGRWAALQVWTKGLPQGRVCILIQNWGRDDDACDGPQAGTDPEFATSFFRDADRILSRAAEWGGSSQFPTPRDAFGSDGRTARYYRHPFLTNAGGNPNTTGVTPLKDWTRQFAAGYKAECPAQSGHGVIPNPDMFTFDTEPVLNQYPHRNVVHLLKTVATNTAIWEGWDVPGYNHTLEYLYNQNVGAGGYNWPADNLSQSDPALRRGILNATTGILDTQDPLNDRNRTFCVWWDEICFRALDEVMRFSGYDVIRDPVEGWGTTVRCGNYRDVQADGLTTFGATTQRVGWFQDRPDNDSTQLFPRLYGASAVARELLPRYQLHPIFGGHQYFAKGTQRYLGIRQWSSGQMDSPVLYPEDPDQFNYLQQVDYYLPNHPLDASVFDSLRRNARRSVETTLNSNPVAGGNSSRLTPWLMMASTDLATGGSNDSDRYYSDVQLREQLMMLRAKNVQDCLFWTLPPTTPYNPGDVDWQNLSAAWGETALALKNVYRPRVNKYTRLSGPVELPGQVNYDPYDTSRLEFTLPDPTDSSKQDYEVELIPTGRLLPGGVRRLTTVLVVDFEWPSAVDQMHDKYDIAIEAAVTFAATTGSVYIWDGAQYQPLRVYDGCDFVDNYTYGFHAPASASDGLYRCRQRFQGVACPWSVWYDSADSKYKTRLKLVQTVDTTLTTVSVWKYDLVQLTPVGGITCTQSALGMARSDTNMDGVVDEGDLVEFMGDWFDNSAAADISLDGAVGVDDFDQYLEAFASGT